MTSFFFELIMTKTFLFRVLFNQLKGKINTKISFDFNLKGFHVNSHFINETKWRIQKSNQRPVLFPSSLYLPSLLFLDWNSSVCNCQFSLVCFTYKYFFLFSFSSKICYKLNKNKANTLRIINLHVQFACMIEFVCLMYNLSYVKFGASDSGCSDLAINSGKYCFCPNSKKRIFLLLLIWITLITIFLQRAHQYCNKEIHVVLLSFTIGHMSKVRRRRNYH